MSGKRIQPVRGMNDILPGRSEIWQHVEQASSEILSAYGYREIRFPIVEHTELFARSIGEVTDIVEKEMYTFEDRNGDSLTLRPEGTAGCVRAGISNGLLHNQIQRLWYAGPMFRHERPQKGRYRQFHQIGVEAYGLEGPDIDAEMILLSARLWKRLGLSDLRLEINSLGTPASRARYREALVEYFAAHRDKLDEDSRRRLDTNPLRILDTKNPELEPLVAGAPEFSDYLDDESRAHFDGLCERLSACGIEYTVNPRLVRGLDYYTRTVFEWLTDRLGAQGAVCSGGRYDGLVDQLGGRATPAVGWAMGMERLVELMETQAALPKAREAHAYLIMVGEPARIEGVRLAERLRDAIPSLRLVTGGDGAGFRSQMKKADKSGAEYALVLGEEEVRTGTVGLKPLRETGDQETVDTDRLEARLQGVVE